MKAFRLRAPLVSSTSSLSATRCACRITAYRLPLPFRSPLMPPQTDYSTWQHAELVHRVHQLERQLQATTQTLARITEQEAAKRPARKFDASKHSTRKIALKFAYLGANYNGLEHHPGTVTALPAVEKALWHALIKTRLISPRFRDGESEDEVCWEGCEYSKCGRTDKGVSSFGQVVGVRVRSARPLDKQKMAKQSSSDDEAGDQHDESTATRQADSAEDEVKQTAFDSVTDELPYIHMLNKVLPRDIRILAWCPNPPSDFDARFSCRERRYRYFFTNPAYLPIPGQPDQRERWLDIDAMRVAAKKYEGLHDFRNFCKIDGAKQITNFNRRIFSSSIHAVNEQEVRSLQTRDRAQAEDAINGVAAPKLYYFEVRGSAFLWHQVRHLVAVLFLVGQGLEQPEVIDELLDVRRTPARPTYLMASDAPLVLWDCIFPDASQIQHSDHATGERNDPPTGYTDSLEWKYINDGQPSPVAHKAYVGDQRYDREGLMESLWTQWRSRKLQEVLAKQLMVKVAETGDSSVHLEVGDPSARLKHGARVFEGDDYLRSVGPYTPLMQRSCVDPPEQVNARYAARKLARSRNEVTASPA